MMGCDVFCVFRIVYSHFFLTGLFLPWLRVFGDPFGEEFPNTIGRGGPFPPSYQKTDPDPEFNAYSIREIYERAGDKTEKYTIPLLWDKVTKTIVNNESSDIAYMFNSCFNEFATNPTLDLYTEDDEEGRAKLNEVSEWLSPLMIYGVYRCGFAKNQLAYDLAISELCEAYDHADDILQTQRYLTGDTLTDADIRLFVTLLRFDEVYAFYFKANARLVMLTPSLLNFCREIYQMPGIAETCDMEQIKAHFYGSHAEWNKYSIIPRGLGFMELLEMPHDRDVLFGPWDGDEDDVFTNHIDTAGHAATPRTIDTFVHQSKDNIRNYRPAVSAGDDAYRQHMSMEEVAYKQYTQGDYMSAQAVSLESGAFLRRSREEKQSDMLGFQDDRKSRRPIISEGNERFVHLDNDTFSGEESV
jgi:putative glutathione S-transferase